MATTRGYVFSDALENLDDPERGATGIQKRDSIPSFNQSTYCL